MIYGYAVACSDSEKNILKQKEGLKRLGAEIIFMYVPSGQKQQGYVLSLAEQLNPGETLLIADPDELEYVGNKVLLVESLATKKGAIVKSVNNMNP